MNINNKEKETEQCSIPSVSGRTLLTNDVWINELKATLVSDKDEMPRYMLDTIEFSYEPMNDNYWIDFLDSTQTKPFTYKDEIELVLKAISAYDR